MPTVCPVHGTQDEIKTLSAIVRDGGFHTTVTVQVDDGYSTRTVGGVTNLARAVARPEPTRARTGTGGWLLLLFCSAFLIFLGLFLLWFASTVIPEAIADMPDMSGWSFVVIVSLIGVAICALAILAPIRVREGNRKYDLEKPIWDRAQERWGRSYYCGRDDIVFDPQTQETCKPEQLQAFLRQTPRVSAAQAPVAMG